MTPLAKGFLTAILFGVAAFCAFGFLATFEPPGFLGMRIIYAAGGLLCLVGAAQVARSGPANR